MKIGEIKIVCGEYPEIPDMEHKEVIYNSEMKEFYLGTEDTPIRVSYEKLIEILKEHREKYEGMNEEFYGG